MKKIFKFWVVFVFTAVVFGLFSGCATIFKGSTDKVNFSSEPTSAQVYVNGNLWCTPKTGDKKEII